MIEKGAGSFFFSSKQRRRAFGGRREAKCDLSCKSRNGPRRTSGDHFSQDCEAGRAPGHCGTEANDNERSPGILSGEAREVRVWDDRISAEEKALLEEGMEMEELPKERRRTKWRASDAVESGFTRKAPSGPEAPQRRSVTPTRLRLTSTGRARGRTKIPHAVLKIRRKRKKRAVMRKEPSETQTCVFCHDMEVNDNWGLEELGFVPSALCEPPRAKRTRDRKYKERRGQVL